MKLPVLMFMLILLSSLAHAAVIQGNIYDLDFKKVGNVLISINTVPKQVFIAENGSYKVEVPTGSYVLEAKEAKNDLYLQTNVNVKDEGEFNLDLILIPSLEEINYLDEYENIADLEINAPAKTNWTIIIALILSAIVAISIILVIFKKSKKENKESKLGEKADKEPESREKNDVERALKIIKSEGGRITQKDLREKLGDMSEAKASLLITELEHKNKVKRIKKGRGNVIILS